MDNGAHGLIRMIAQRHVEVERKQENEHVCIFHHLWRDKTVQERILKQQNAIQMSVPVGQS